MTKNVTEVPSPPHLDPVKIAAGVDEEFGLTNAKQLAALGGGGPKVLKDWTTMTPMPENFDLLGGLNLGDNINGVVIEFKAVKPTSTGGSLTYFKFELTPWHLAAPSGILTPDARIYDYHRRSTTPHKTGVAGFFSSIETNYRGSGTIELFNQAIEQYIYLGARVESHGVGSSYTEDPLLVYEWRVQYGNRVRAGAGFPLSMVMTDCANMDITYRILRKS